MATRTSVSRRSSRNKLSQRQLLQSAGFDLVPYEGVPRGDRWFTKPVNADGVALHLLLAPKRLSRTWEVQIGWRHTYVLEFVLDAMAEDWPRGMGWLRDVGVASHPCLTVFPVGMHLEWPSRGIRYDESEGRQDVELLILHVTSHGWEHFSCADVLEIYTDGPRPFGWVAANAALLAAEIAGYCRLLGLGADRFDELVHPHSKRIDTHMFGMGSGSEWVSQLRRRLQLVPGNRADGAPVPR